MPEAPGKANHLIGVDLGGTKILGGVFSTSLELKATIKFSTKARRGPESVIERTARCVRDAADEADISLKDIRAVGVGVPGAVRGGDGHVLFAPNLDWHDVRFKELLENELGMPVFVENDCNVAALGVYVVELKSAPSSMLGVFIGTGIGGGVVLHGELYPGFSHTAGEIGHMVMDLNGPKCACGSNGCFEALASRTAIFQRLKDAIQAGEKSLLTDLVDHLEDMRSGDLRKALRRGDKLVRSVLDDAAVCIGRGVASLANVLNPEVIVLGGGVMEALSEEMLGTIIDAAHHHAMVGALDGVEIRASLLGDKAGITGAAVLAKQMSK